MLSIRRLLFILYCLNIACNMRRLSDCLCVFVYVFFLPISSYSFCSLSQAFLCLLIYKHTESLRAWELERESKSRQRSILEFQFSRSRTHSLARSSPFYALFIYLSLYWYQLFVVLTSLIFQQSSSLRTLTLIFVVVVVVLIRCKILVCLDIHANAVHYFSHANHSPHIYTHTTHINLHQTNVRERSTTNEPPRSQTISSKTNGMERVRGTYVQTSLNFKVLFSFCHCAVQRTIFHVYVRHQLNHYTPISRQFLQ